MTHISQLIGRLIERLRLQNEYADALPDLAVSLLESAIEEGDYLDERTMGSIHEMVHWEGFPEDKKWKILALLAQIHRRPTVEAYNPTREK